MSSPTTLPHQEQHLRPHNYAASLCPQCGKYSNLMAKFCDACGHGLCNPLVIVDDVIDNLRFGKMLTFAFKLTTHL
jgi:hypothetical protein